MSVGSDRAAMLVLAAERECRTIEILAEHAPISEIARDYFDFALKTIQAALDVRRAEVGLAPRLREAA